MLRHVPAKGNVRIAATSIAVALRFHCSVWLDLWKR